MFRIIKIKYITILICICALIVVSINTAKNSDSIPVSSGSTIKWVDFNVSTKCMSDAMNEDIKTQSSEYPVNWTDIIAYLACIYGNNFSQYSKNDMDDLMKKISSGKTVEEITRDMKYFDYYKECYEAVLGGFIGDYKIGIRKAKDETVFKQKYGLKAFSPVAAGYSYNHYDDFGNSRSYGYKRKHMGNDLMGSVGTPIIAVESGYIEAIGWNMYGGWRIGIRSFDKKRYYYYAHLRRNHPYAKDFKQGDRVDAGTVIGYLGMTGYSREENVNNINIPHLHFGMQIIFDEAQKDGSGEIWIDVYDIVKLLSQNRSETVYNEALGEHQRKHIYKELG